MKHKKQLSFILSLIFIFLSGCSHISIPSNVNTAFENFTLCLFKEEVATSTLNLHYSLQNPAEYGITDIPVTFGSYDFDKQAALASIENLETALHQFPYKSLSAENQLTYDILDYYFTSVKTGASYHLYDEPLSPVTGIHTQLPVLLAEYQFYDIEDVNIYLALLETLPDYFDSLVRFEEEKSAAGLFMSDSHVDEVIAQCNAFLSMGESNYLLSTFEERLDTLDEMDSEERTELIRKNQKVLNTFVLPAYESLAHSIASLKGTGKNAKGLCSLPEGKSYYEHLVATSTGSSRPVAELKSLIQGQIAVDLLDSQEVLNEHPSLAEEATTLTESPDSILKTLESRIAKVFPTSASVNVEIKYVPNALQEYLSPAFYLIPAIDNFQENTIYINQAYTLDDIHLFTTLAHEGYPGHLYQTTYFANTNPDPIRTLISFHGYVEGWATYAEMCSYYISPLEKSYATLLQKNNSIILGLYAAADLGIHYDGWTLEDTVSFFSGYGINDKDTVQEIYRYIVGDPANYLMYYVGYLEILELKKEMITEKGTGFSQMDFHQKVLEIGPAPFEIIRKHVTRIRPTTHSQ